MHPHRPVGAWTLVALLLASMAAPAQEPTWTGRRVIPRQPGLRIGESDAKGNLVQVAELTSLGYTVLEERDGFVRLSHRGRTGWLPKTDVLLPESAVEFFRQRAGEDVTTMAFLGWAYVENHDLQQALKCYDDVIRRGPTADWHNNRGAILVELNQSERAVADFTEAMRLNPKLDLSIENRARALTKLKKTQEAIADWTELLRRNPSHVEALVQRGLLHESRKDAISATLDLNRAVALAPASVPVRLDRARLLGDLGRNEAALEDFAEAIRLAKSTPDELTRALSMRAGVYTQLKQYDRAIQDLEETLKLAPENVEALEARGWNRFLSGKFEDANRDFDTVLRSQPNNPSPYNCQAWLWATCPKAELRNGKKALEYAQKAVAMSQEKDPIYLDTLAAALAELGRFEEALKLQERVVREAADDAELLAEVQGRLELYRKKQPYRQPIGK